MDDLYERHNALIERLLRLIDSTRERLGDPNTTFARENVEAGEWELAIEIMSQASRHRLVLTPSERHELAEIEASLRHLQPEMGGRNFRDILRGILLDAMSAARRRRR